MAEALLCCSARTSFSINWVKCHHPLSHIPNQCLSVTICFVLLVVLQSLVPSSKFTLIFYYDKTFIQAVQYMAKLFHRPISQEKWFLRALKHVSATFWANNASILEVVKLLYPGVNLPILYKRILLKVRSCQRWG